MSQRVVAKRLDRSQAFVWKVEEGTQHLDIPTLIELAKLYEVSAADLLRQVKEALL